MRSILLLLLLTSLPFPTLSSPIQFNAPPGSVTLSTGQTVPLGAGVICLGRCEEAEIIIGGSYTKHWIIGGSIATAVGLAYVFTRPDSPTISGGTLTTDLTLFTSPSFTLTTTNGSITFAPVPEVGTVLTLGTGLLLLGLIVKIRRLRHGRPANRKAIQLV